MNHIVFKLIHVLKKRFPNRILCQRIFKCVVNSTITLIFCLIPKVVKILGDEPSMLPLISVMVHPGRRFGIMIEAVIFCISGLLLGNAYSLFGRFLAQKALGEKASLEDSLQRTENYHNYEAALAILAVFEIFMLFFHGWMRSVSHKFFAMVFPLFLVVHFTFMDDLKTNAGTIAKNFTTPFFLGIALSLACNLLIFPEFGSTYLGRSMVTALNEFHNTIDLTVQFFITIQHENSLYNTECPSLADITKQKTSLRAKLNSTQAVLQECIYEISYSYLSPAQLKPVIAILKSQVSYICALINASQLEFTLLNNEKKSNHDDEQDNDLLYKVLARARGPIYNLQKVISESLYVIKLGIAKSYDVKLSNVTKSLNLEMNDIEISLADYDEKINSLASSMAHFDLTIRSELENLSTEHEDYLSPNDNMFLLSSFLMNLKETANAVCNVMKETKTIYEYRLEREQNGFLGKKIWFSFLTSTDQLKGWFSANRNDMINSNETASLNGDPQSKIYLGDDIRPRRETLTFDNDTNNNQVLEKLQSPDTPSHNYMDRCVVTLLNLYKKHKPHFRFGIQITVGLMVASFPMFIPKSREWYVDIRGAWIGFVCILVLEPQVGSTFFVFFLRGVGVISGAAWGYLSYVAAINQTNPYLETIVTVIGAIPGYYYFLGTPYVKAAIIGIISIYIVLLSSALPNAIGGSILENFGKRCLAMIYGGAVALICQLLIFPIKARDELISEVSDAVGIIAKLQLIYAVGLDGEDSKLSMTEARYENFRKFSTTAKSALTRADAYRTSARKEPRLKGSYKGIERVIYEIIFILREILDRMDNIILLRRIYGSAIIEEFNPTVFPYRRQVTASINNALKAVQFALVTKAPLPQYLPSAKIAHQRLVKKVRDLVHERYPKIRTQSSSDSECESEIVVEFNGSRRRLQNSHNEHLLKERFLSWNATSSATEEVIDYLEELVELSRLLVGVHEFKYGFLSRSLYSEYAARAARGYKSMLSKNNIVRRSSTSSAANPREDDGLNEEIASSIEDYDVNPIALVNTDTSSTSKRSMGTTEGQLSNGFRKRIYSIGSWVRGGELTKTKSLGEFKDGEDEVDEDEELPLSLMRVVSKKSTIGK